MDIIEAAQVRRYPTRRGVGGVHEPSGLWIRRHHRRPLRFAKGLGAWVRTNLPDVYHGDSHADHVIPTVILIRMTVTFAGLIRLCERGYGEQAMMLYRAMFEDMLVAHWAADDPERAADRLRKQERHGELLVMRDDPLDGESFEYEPSFRPPTPQESAELDGLFGEHGQRNLTGKNLWSLVNEAAPKLRPAEAEELRFSYRFLIRNANRTLHSSADTLGHSVTPLPAGDDAILGQPNAQIAMPLFASTWCLYRVACLVHEQIGTPHEDLDRLYWRGRHAFDVSYQAYLQTGGDEAVPGALYSLDHFQEALDGTPADDPCLCGSPFSFGACCRGDYVRLLHKNRRLHRRLRVYVDSVLAGAERYQQALPDD